MSALESHESDLSNRLAHAEFCCWTMLIISPILYWIQGPSVSPDQFVVRAAVTVLAALGAVGMRAYALLQKRQTKHAGASDRSTADRTTANPYAASTGASERVSSDGPCLS